MSQFTAPAREHFVNLDPDAQVLHFPGLAEIVMRAVLQRAITSSTLASIENVVSWGRRAVVRSARRQRLLCGYSVEKLALLEELTADSIWLRQLEVNGDDGVPA
ncbi:hypothetical protein, partial [Roseivivax lentus]|uniref:hypothetical protein n=1 Tax=Roseivivax lentus TaxID=633194 RepID=UPI00117BC434